MIGRYVFGEDVFISYSRRDGMTYAAALASELTGRGLTCHIDVYDSQPGKEMPESLTAALKRSFLLVVVGSHSAADSRHVRQEIETFAALGRHMIVLDFDGAVEYAHWRASVEGLGWKQESAADLAQGNPTASTISLIENSFRFRRRNQRLAITFWSIAAGIALLLAIGAVSGFFIRRSIIQARSELSKTNAQLGDASRELTKAQTELTKSKGDLDVVETNLGKTRADLTTAEEQTELQSKVATAQRLRAEVQGRRAASGYNGVTDALFSLQASNLFDAAQMPAEAYAALAQGTSALPRFASGFQHPGPISGLFLAPDGHMLITTGGGMLRLWDYRSGRQIGRAFPHESLLHGAEMSADGSYLVTRTRRAVELWNLAGNLETSRTFECPESLEAAAISASGALIAFGCGSKLHVVRRSGEPYPVVSVFDGVNDLRFTPDDQYVTVKGSDESDSATVFKVGATLDKVEPVDGCLIKTNASNIKVFEPASLTLSRDGRYVLRSRRGLEFPVFGNNEVRLCEVPNLRVRAILPHSGATTEDVSPDGSHVVTAEDGIIRLWETRQGRMVGTFRPDAPTRQAQFSRDGRYILTNSLVAADVPDARIAGVIPTSVANLSVVTGGGQVITADGKSGRISVWDTQSVQRGAALNYTGSFRLARFSPTGKYVALMSVDSDVTGNDYPEAVVWSLVTGERILSTRSDFPYDAAVRVAFHPDEDQIAILYAGKYEDDPSRVEFRKISALDQPPSTMTYAFLRDIAHDERRGWIGVATSPQRSILFQLSDGREIVNWNDNGNSPCEFRAYGRLVICSDRRGVSRTIDVQRGTEVSQGAPAAASDVAIDSAGRYVAVQAQKIGLRISDSSGLDTWTIALPNAHASFGPGGKLLVASNQERTEIWNLATHSRIAIAAGAPFGFLSPNSQSLLSVWDAHIESRPWNTSDFRRATCSLLQRNIQMAGWSLLVDSAAYGMACPGSK